MQSANAAFCKAHERSRPHAIDLHDRVEQVRLQALLPRERAERVYILGQTTPAETAACPEKAQNLGSDATPIHNWRQPPIKLNALKHRSHVCARRGFA